MGKIATELSDHVILTSDNPRKEDPYFILKEIEMGITKPNYEIIEDRKTAIFKAVRLARPGDMVLIAGKGHEDYQEIHSDKIWFDDDLDIAVLKIVDEEGYMPTDLVAAQIAPMENQVQIGQFSLAIGNSLAEYQNSVTMGIISARNRELKINTSNLYI